MPGISSCSRPTAAPGEGRGREGTSAVSPGAWGRLQDKEQDGLLGRYGSDAVSPGRKGNGEKSPHELQEVLFQAEIDLKLAAVWERGRELPPRGPPLPGSLFI